MEITIRFRPCRIDVRQGRKHLYRIRKKFHRRHRETSSHATVPGPQRSVESAVAPDSLPIGPISRTSVRNLRLPPEYFPSAPLNFWTDTLPFPSKTCFVRRIIPFIFASKNLSTDTLRTPARHPLFFSSNIFLIFVTTSSFFNPFV